MKNVFACSTNLFHVVSCRLHLRAGHSAGRRHLPSEASWSHDDLHAQHFLLLTNPPLQAADRRAVRLHLLLQAHRWHDNPPTQHSLLSTTAGCTHEQIVVQSNSTYRIRLIGGTELMYTTVCFEGHNVTVITADAFPVESWNTSCVDINAGQR